MVCFVGYCDSVKEFRIYSPSEGRFILSRGVIFEESTMYSNKSKKTCDLGKYGENFLKKDRVVEVH